MATSDWPAPQIDHSRCVHSFSRLSECCECIGACPHSALDFDGIKVSLDENSCSGCNLCTGACPQQAITALDQIMIKNLDDKNTCFAACHRSAAQASTSPGLIFCLHQLSVDQLLHYYNQGVSEWMIARADCEVCEYSSSDNDFDENITRINDLLDARGLAPIMVSEKSKQSWDVSLSTAQADPGPALTRRQLFGFSLNKVVHAHEAVNVDQEQHQNNWRPAFSDLENNIGAMHINTISIDPMQCSGCDACVRLCPNHAIEYGVNDDLQYYQLHHEYCTDCGLCVDACEDSAVTIEAWQQVEQVKVELQGGHCRHCGSAFHLPAAAEIVDVCPVCRKTSHHKKLYQVID